VTRLTTPFGFHSTAADVASGIDLAGKHVIVTGATSGIGIETAKAIASTGAIVTLAVRNVIAGARVAHEIGTAIGRETVRVRALDLADYRSIDLFAASWTDPLHVLINNAGVMAPPDTHTDTGWETQFAINHLGHFRLATGLREALASDGTARIVSVSSSSHQIGPIDFEDIHFTRRPYGAIAAYGQSKTANILFAVEATSRWARDGITANALMPGAVPTNLQRYIGGMKTPVELRKTVEQGAATSVLLAVSPVVEGVGGRYFADCNEAVVLEDGERDMTKVAPHALDPANAARLWDVSLEMLEEGP
jgi:NAD(P)-dependent dehydrogenase (short-subunit alcohol dehydrogenase family)